MYNYAFLKPLMEAPEKHQPMIETILTKAKSAESDVNGFLEVLQNPFNEEMRLQRLAVIVFLNEKNNVLYAAAQLMLGIPGLKTAENIALSQHYLEFAGSTHRYKPALHRLGWFHSQGEGGVVDYQKAVTCFNACGDFSGAYLSAGYCYEQLGKVEQAMGCYQQLLQKDPDNEKAQRHLADCKAKLRDKVSGSTPFFAVAAESKDDVADSRLGTRAQQILL